MNSVERYYQKKQKRKKRAKVFFFSLLFVLLLLTLSILSMTVFFNAETIIVEGNQRYSAEALLEQGGLTVGQNLFRLDKFKVIEKMQEFPYVKEVTIRRHLPNTLKVTIVENQPVVWVSTGSKVALLNEYYRVLEYVDYQAPEEPSDPVEPAEKPAESKTEEELQQETSDQEETADQPEEEPQQKPEEEATEDPEPIELPEQLANIPRLTRLELNVPEVGETITFAQEADYTGFLERLYLAFQENPDLDWNRIGEIRFHARYDIELIYADTITIDLGTLDQADTKVELAAYLLKDNGISQTAILDVSDVERVYYRPQK